MRFRDHQRVQVVSGPFAGLAGSVCRLLRRDNFHGHEGWVRLDERTDESLPWPFPDDDAGGRARDVLLEAADCEALPTAEGRR